MQKEEIKDTIFKKDSIATKQVKSQPGINLTTMYRICVNEIGNCHPITPTLTNEKHHLVSGLKNGYHCISMDQIYLWLKYTLDKHRKVVCSKWSAKLGPETCTPETVWPPFSAPHRVAMSTLNTPQPHSPDAAQFLSVDCIACVNIGCEQHIGTTEARDQPQPAAPNFQPTWLLISPPELPAPHAPQR